MFHLHITLSWLSMQFHSDCIEELFITADTGHCEHFACVTLHVVVQAVLLLETFMTNVTLKRNTTLNIPKKDYFRINKSYQSFKGCSYKLYRMNRNSYLKWFKWRMFLHVYFKFTWLEKSLPTFLTFKFLFIFIVSTSFMAV